MSNFFPKYFKLDSHKILLIQNKVYTKLVERRKCTF